jgi:hypothetical protein
VFLGRVVEAGEPQWLPEDRDRALWWLIHDREVCPSCGTRPSDWDEAGGGDLQAYRAEVAGCRGCQVRAGAEEQFEKARKEYPRGSYVRLVRNPEVIR